MMREDVQAMKRSVDALVALLTEWADWQRGYRMKLGYPSHSAGMGGGGLQSFDDMCDAVDSESMRITDAVIQDLPPAQCAAIMRRYGVAAVFRFPRQNYEQCLMDAHERLILELPRKGVIVL